MESYVFFGAGKIGRRALFLSRIENRDDIAYFVDNNKNLWGKYVEDIPVIRPQDIKCIPIPFKLILTCNARHKEEIVKQLKGMGITDYSWYNEKQIFDWIEQRERVFSYSTSKDYVDVILYHIFHEYDELFYIDIGCGDPVIDNATILLYNKKKANGINIDPDEKAIALNNSERIRDINISAVVSETVGERPLIRQKNGLSTICKNLERKEYTIGEKTSRSLSLKQICDNYLERGMHIHILKIDAQGAEEEVLLSADFINYRPYVVVIKATYPMSMIPSYEEWENLLLENHYHFVYKRGANRYYVADERRKLDRRFDMIQYPEYIQMMYNIYRVNITHDCY